MNLPECPYVARGQCPRSDPQQVSENDETFLFTCRTCQNFWGYSKDFVKGQARYQRGMERLKRNTEWKKATERKREYSY